MTPTEYTAAVRERQRAYTEAKDRWRTRLARDDRNVFRCPRCDGWRHRYGVHECARRVA